MDVPVDTTEYVNADDTTDMATVNPLSVKMAYADTILQMPPLTSNVIHIWCEGDGATLYDEADPADIRLLPLIGERKKLVVGEQYQLIVEADRFMQYNPCSHGRAVTGGWSFEITDVTDGEIEDNVIILDQFETGELVIEVMENADKVFSQKKFILYDESETE